MNKTDSDLLLDMSEEGISFGMLIECMLIECMLIECKLIE
ncbi:hypothetical protein BTM377_13750 [Helicobacter pylori]